ncbi:tRNA (adenosine(37)-N6)-threonylcarbamoyltransferase complex transferase subunit TsaD [Geobacter sp. SVR]|uniref:tRNA (adenosine(37)-N6)-threonylcarbamoyltransferase complex transferase subunit TsaD n=1 Tax=Geobacter sp. SVR TaxID=2495594 RepID=UPI00143F03D6|nr:tRNA (adenosine(37)-N6)-threonylcarbamoyltransferase complex transferase subunit TsaD [Geobacter sp. SVR]BCS54321.1 tRNA N6-adenosine threonylcarbamoyltransferase [Geobacter sp. SVR]GCF85820.1 tRNA N6-adenosine threonylcarbamoyltransferase [Geobacter sp. SVR]
MLLLAIETSCDETAAAVVADGRRILSSVVSSQVAVHAEYGGVVPEIASRKHLEMISPVIGQALQQAGVAMSAIEGIAVTRGPGLSGALLVGLSAAKAIACARAIPFVGVHHIEGHIFAAFLEQPVEFPFLALVVSGGHTHLYLVEGFGRYRTLGRTLDDAAGEAFDKSAKIMGFEYPGGVRIDRMAQDGNPDAVKLPRPLMRDGSLNFSFSGLKTAVLQHVAQHPVSIPSAAADDLCASFQRAVCDVLAAKTEAALRETGARRLVVAGGVACNSGLRARMRDLAQSLGLELHIPDRSLCGDNAAMLAVAGNYYLEKGAASPMTLDVTATWDMDSIGEAAP